MDNSPLNQAHREQRRAEALSRSGRLEEASSSHARAAQLLTAALALTPSALARQSITLQHSFHLRQQELLKFRSKQLEKYVKAMENQRLKMGGGVGSGSSGAREASPSGPYTNKRAQAITLQVTKYGERFDSLLSMLVLEEEDDEENEELKVSTEDKEEEKPTTKDTHRDKPSDATKEEVKVEEATEAHATTFTGHKKEKNVSVIVEELRTLRDHQADLISQLMNELAHMERENTQLKSQVRELQGKCEQYEGERRRMRALADSSCSPFVFSPLSELSPDPPSVDLAPLEMPPLDFMDNLDKDS